MGVRNKYCATCAAFNRKNSEPPEHKCYKNWIGSSSSMEADIIVQGFTQSVPLYGVKYARMIGDGDSNVYKKILDARPYDNISVEKIECVNHVLRNFCNKLKEIAKDSKLGHIQFRKLLGSNILRLRSAIVKAAEFRKNDVRKLRDDIMNAPYHIFGEHGKCDTYFCTRSNNIEKNYIPELKNTAIFIKIMEIVSNVAVHSKSLLFNANNNAVEIFNALIAKHIGGKRVNFALKGSYQTRCNTSVLSHNTKRKYHQIYRELSSNSPGHFCKRRENREAKRLINRNKRQRKMRSFPRTLFPDSSYGYHSEKPDMPLEEYKIKEAGFLKSLERNEEQRIELERKTVTQQDSPLWREVRKTLLTSSNFGAVCNKMITTSCKNIVKNILYRNIDTQSMKYGRMHEKDAIKSLEEYADIKIMKCGIFVDENLNFLAASPDGIVKNNDQYIVEVKCPSSCENMFPNEAILQKKFTFWKTDKTKSIITGINKKHPYYYQVQGQLHITKRQYCLFTLWTSKGIKVTKIERDDTFWYTEMEEKLRKFYFDCLLPEIVDPRYTRSMQIRDPEYILNEIRKKNLKM